MFSAAHGVMWFVYVALALLVSVGAFFLLQLIPQRLRRPVIMTVTFLGGLFFAVEFFWPTHPMPTRENPDGVGNFLTPYIVPFGTVANVIAAFTVGMGVINLCQVHGKRIAKGAPGAFNSVAFFISMILMFAIGILGKAHPNPINKNLYELLFTGGLVTLDATMFSIIAFYIVSAAYRAFRVRSVEATLLLVTAVVVMLGQIAVGQLMTSWLPKDSFAHNFRVEGIRSWILTIANAAATRAISFGLGIGGLAVALRIWLGLERGSYFDR
jgi:hypothetical protein